MWPGDMLFTLITVFDEAHQLAMVVSQSVSLYDHKIEQLHLWLHVIYGAVFICEKVSFYQFLKIFIKLIEFTRPFSLS